MLPKRDPIGSSTDDIKHSGGQKMREDYKRRYNSIFLGEKRRSDDQIEPVQEQDEDDEDLVVGDEIIEGDIVTGLLLLDQEASKNPKKLIKRRSSS